MHAGIVGELGVWNAAGQRAAFGGPASGSPSSDVLSTSTPAPRSAKRGARMNTPFHPALPSNARPRQNPSSSETVDPAGP